MIYKAPKSDCLNEQNQGGMYLCIKTSKLLGNAAWYKSSSTTSGNCPCSGWMCAAKPFYHEIL